MRYTKSLPFALMAGALGAAMLACSSVSRLPNPFASATPTATATFTPSPTPTLTPTATPQPTGTAMETLPNGGTHFVDYDYGYAITISPTWLVLPPDLETIQKRASQLLETNPGLADALKGAQELKPDAFRVIAYDTLRTHYAKGFVANFTVGTAKDKLSTSMPLDLLLDFMIDQIKTQMPSIKVTRHDPAPNAHGVPIGALELQMPLTLRNGNRLNIYEKQLYFQTRQVLVIVTFTTLQSNVELIAPSFDAVIDGIEILPSSPAGL